MVLDIISPYGSNLHTFACSYLKMQTLPYVPFYHTHTPDMIYTHCISYYVKSTETIEVFLGFHPNHCSAQAYLKLIS